MALSLLKRFLMAQAFFILCGGGSAWGLTAPTGLMSLSGDQSVILHWDQSTDPTVAGYKVYRSTNGISGPYQALNSMVLWGAGFCDLAGVLDGQTNFYRVTTINIHLSESAPSDPVAAAPHPFADDGEFLDYLQEANFDYFWYLANPTNGLIPDRSTTTSPCSIAAVGFGLTALGIGADHGWITRAQAAARTLLTLNTFLQGPQNPGASGVMGYKGWFYHFLDMKTGLRASGCELSTIDTALFLAGALYARQYFSGTNEVEQSIRDTANTLIARVDWTFMSQGTSALALAWQPTTGFSGYGNWTGYNEAMLLYCLGMGAESNALPAASWSVWTNGYQWGTEQGQTYLTFGPLFGHFFSHCWIDFRHIADACMNAHESTYFENSRRAALAQVAYCASGPYPGYSSNIWGLTACDGPDGYRARGLPPDASDDGTIAPTAAGGCVPFAPEAAIPALEAMDRTYRQNLWTAFGLRDAFNPGQNWFDSDELGIDQGPIVIMIENYRTQRVWRLFMQCPEIQRGLAKAGFMSLPSMALNLDAKPRAAVNLTWKPQPQRFYQVEYSPDLFDWLTSPNLVRATNNGSFTWQDEGPPETVSAPGSASQRFYHVYQLGAP